MDVNFTSTHLLNNRIRNSVQKMQGELSRKQVELSTGKKFDSGLELGSLTSHLVAARRQIQSIEQTRVTNGLVANRLSVMQDALEGMVSSAQNVVGQIAAEMSDVLDRDLLGQIGRAGIEDFTSLMNTSYRGEYVFSGVNSDVPALNPYSTDPLSPAQTAVRAAFQAEFGFPPDDPGAATIDAASMTAFLEGAFSDLFDDASWQSLWTGASDRGIRVKFSLTDVTELPVNGNDGGFRKMAAGFAALAELGATGLDDQAMDAVVQFTMTSLTEGVADLGGSQSRLGIVEQRVTQASEKMDYQEIVLKNGAAALEEVDSYETAMRINELLASIEASYSVTSRIQGLSIMNFI